jgi:hypothetical protein
VFSTVAQWFVPNARETVDNGFTGSGRFEMRNTLRPSESALCGGLQEGSLAPRA